MSIIKYLKSLFSPGQSGIPKTKIQIQMPPVKPLEPSCLVKGVAQAWIKEKGWRVERKDKRVVLWIGNVPPNLFDITLRHSDLGITIEGIESDNIYGLSLSIEGRLIDLSTQDRTCLAEAIEAHPYVSLRRRRTEKARQESFRAAKIKRLEERGCPKQQPGIMRTPA